MSFKFNALTGGFNTFTQADLTTIGGSNDLSFADNAKIKFGASDDLRIYHYQSHSYIDNNTNNLYINAPNYFHLGVSNGGDKYITATENGVVELYYDGSKKFETTSLGTTVTGQLDVQGANNTTFDHVGTISLLGTDAYNSGNAGAGINFSGKYNSSNAVTTLAQISGIKEDTSDGTYDGALTFGVRNDAEGVNIERMRIDSSGRVGIGTSSLGSYNANADNLVIVDSGHSGISIQSGTSSNGVLAFTDGANTSWQGFVEYEHNGNNLKFGTDGDVRLTIDGSGGVTAGGDIVITANTGSLKLYAQSGYSECPCIIQNTGNNTAADFIQFKGWNASIVGSISGFVNSTSYATSSDYRLKENEVAISDGITRLKTLKPYRFNFKTTPSEIVDGFFAHEVTPAVPEAVVGEKDGTKMQGIDHSKLVPLLTAALKEAITKIETLETKVAALEAA